MQVQLAAPAPQLAHLLAGHEVAHLDASGATPTTVYLPAGDLHARAALLGKLVAAGVPVCAFQEVRTSLQMSYGQADSHNPLRAAP